MKTIILDSKTKTVINVGCGEPELPPPFGVEFIVVEDDFWIDIGSIQDENGNFIVPEKPEDQEMQIIQAETPVELTIEEKLASVGLSIEDLKKALGLT